MTREGILSSMRYLLGGLKLLTSPHKPPTGKCVVYTKKYSGRGPHDHVISCCCLMGVMFMNYDTEATVLCMIVDVTLHKQPIFYMSENFHMHWVFALKYLPQCHRFPHLSTTQKV